MINVKTFNLSDYSVYKSTLQSLEFDSKMLVNTLNPYSLLVAEKDHEFKRALMASDVLLPDGVGIVAAIGLILQKKIKKIAGSDLHDFLLNKLNKEGGRCFYMGASQNTLQKIKDRIEREYPYVQAAFYSPSYGVQIHDDENLKIIKQINDFAPGVLFVGMTAPKQEKWAYAHKQYLNVDVICCIGAVFDFFAGTKKRSSQIFIDLGLEWLERLSREPKRLWKRSVLYGPIFIYWMFKKKAVHLKQTGQSAFPRYPAKKNILIIGYNSLSRQLTHYIEEGCLDRSIIGFCEEQAKVADLTHYPVLCNINTAIETSINFNVSEIYSTISPDHDARIGTLMKAADVECIRFKLITGTEPSLEKQLGVNYVKDLRVVSVRKEPLEKQYNCYLKRLTDVIVSSMACIFILSWLTPLLGLCIYLETRGPIFFIQHRRGRNKQPFSCIKFRSMRLNKHSDTRQAVKNDPRFTIIGRFIRHTGLDEFPQFMNVLIGNMSLVGPRPHMLKHTSDFSKADSRYGARHFIKPGITGWAQVKSFRGEITNDEQVQERTDHDLWYIENWSLWLDIKILMMTVARMLKGEKDAF